VCLVVGAFLLADDVVWRYVLVMEQEQVEQAIANTTRARERRQSIRAVVIVLALVAFGIAVVVYGRMSGMR